VGPRPQVLPSLKIHRKIDKSKLVRDAALRTALDSEHREPAAAESDDKNAIYR
jgi:hypothetical protein